MSLTNDGAFAPCATCVSMQLHCFLSLIVDYCNQWDRKGSLGRWEFAVKVAWHHKALSFRFFVCGSTLLKTSVWVVTFLSKCNVHRRHLASNVLAEASVAHIRGLIPSNLFMETMTVQYLSAWYFKPYFPNLSTHLVHSMAISLYQLYITKEFVTDWLLLLNSPRAVYINLSST